MEEEQDRDSESAEALEALAGQENVSPAEALQSQAQTEEPETEFDFSRLEAEEADPEDFSPPDEQAPWPDEDAPSWVAEAGGSNGDSMEARQARAASVERRSRHAHAHQFKKMMIPLLIVVGTLLFILGAVAASVIKDTDTSVDLGPFSVQTARYFALAAFPLGVILWLGAWLFHLDVSRSDKR